MKKLITVFKSGTHTDRYGKTREYTESDLQEFINQTSQGTTEIIPLQFTHENGQPAEAGINKSDLFIENQIDPADGKVKSFIKGVVTGAIDKVKSAVDASGMREISSAIDLVGKKFVHFALVKEGAIQLPAAFSNEDIAVYSMSTIIESEATMLETLNAKFDKIISHFQKNKEENEMDEKLVQKMIEDSAKAQKVEFEKQATAAQAEFEKQKKELADKIAALETEKLNLQKAEFEKNMNTKRAEFTAHVDGLVKSKRIFAKDAPKLIEIGMKLIPAGEVQFSKDEQPVAAFELFKEMVETMSTGFDTELTAGAAGERVEFQLPDGIRKEDLSPEMLKMYVEDSKKRAEKK
jgi:hypothetical protein